MTAPAGVPSRAADLVEAMAATWPAAATRRLGPWLLREGAGGGKRVSAATALGPVTPADLARAEAAMREAGQAPLVQVLEGQADLDALLAAEGYAVVDPVTLYAGPLAPVAALDLPRLAAYPVWEPLAVMAEIWAEGGIGPARLAVMRRAPAPRTALLGRAEDRPAGVAFVAVHRGIAMVHALEVRAAMRRRGVARHLMIGAARWAAAQGADRLGLAVTRANAGANALYRGLGMQPEGAYHYRLKSAAE